MNTICRYGNNCRQRDCRFCTPENKKTQFCRYGKKCKYSDKCWYLHTNNTTNNNDELLKKASLKYVIIAINVYDYYKCTTCSNSSKYLIAEKGVECNSQHICETCLVSLENNMGESITFSEKCSIM